MKRRLFFIILAVLLFVLIGNRVWRSSRQPDTKSISQLQMERGIPVEVHTVSTGEVSEFVELSGTVQGIAQSDLISRITERVARVNVSTGQRVRKGQVLIAFDTSSPMAQYRQAKAALADAERNSSRMKALFEEGAVSRQVFEQAESGLEIARANFQAASSLVEITSPISGVVTSVNVHEGQIVHTGSVVCTVARVDSVKIVADAGQTELRGLRVGNRVLIAGSQETKIPGYVYSVSSSANPETRTFRVEMVADNSSGFLKPGSFVTAEILTLHKENVLTVPSLCITEAEGETKVFVVTEDDRAELRPVSVGITSERSAEILEGLREGERIVKRGQEPLKGGEKLKVLEAE
jgi:RND family efflux transporter MFP subunit